MPAKSQKQQKLFGIALAAKRGKLKGASKKVKEIAKEMPEKEIEKFAKTKRKGLKESHVLSFGQFINEDAYVDRHGDLQDLEFTPEEEYRLATYDNIKSISDFLEDAGADNVTHEVYEEFLNFILIYRGEEYLFSLNLDTDRVDVVNSETGVTIYSGNTDALFDMIKVEGLDFLIGI